MALEPALRRTIIPLHDPTFQQTNAKRRVPESFRTQIQEIPRKALKTEAKSTTTANNRPNLPCSSACIRDVTTYQPDMINCNKPTPTNTPKPDLDHQVQLPLKVKYEASVRRFTVPASTSFKDLRLSLAKKMLEDKVMSIEYKDDQGDTVLLSSDNDMAQFSRIIRSRGMNPIHLRVNLWPR